MVKYGTTRVVILVLGMAIKIPIFWRGIKIFAKGWLGNIDEINLWRELEGHYTQSKLAPIKFQMFGKLILFMRKAEPYEFDHKYPDEYNAKILLMYFSDIPLELDICSRDKNFGMIDGRIVLIDYAVCRESTTECDNCYCKSIDR